MVGSSCKHVGSLRWAVAEEKNKNGQKSFGQKGSEGAQASARPGWERRRVCCALARAYGAPDGRREETGGGEEEEDGPAAVRYWGGWI